MNLKQVLCENIAKRRKKLGLTQAALAERLHLSPEAMTRMEKGQIAPKLARLDSIARNLQCTVPDLLRPYKEEKPRSVEIIEDALVGLPEEAQEAIVNLVLESSRIFRDQLKKP